MLKIDLNIKLFNQIISLRPHKVSGLYSKFSNFKLWLVGEGKPTINQLKEIAHFLNIPFGYFFLNELPDYIFPIPHYRKTNNVPFEPSEELKDTVKSIQMRQEWIKDILIDDGFSELSFVGSINLNTNIKLAVKTMKEALKLKDFRASEFSNWKGTNQYLINQVEEAGIFVVINGIVGNNTHRKLDVNEFRGFVLTDKIAPFIFINNNDAKTAQIFTLAHELAHIWLGISASCELRDLKSSNNQTEIFCDKLAAEFLVPEDDLITQYHINSDYINLARIFKVSRIVILRRLLDLKLITKDSFYELFNENYIKDRLQPKTSGGDFYNNIPFRISKKFGEIIFRATKEGKITYRDAFKLTDLKAKTFDHYFKETL